MADVFISYARSSASQAEAVADALRALGFSVWRDDELPPHRAYAEVIEERLRSSKAVVVMWSAEAVKSQWVRAEADMARNAGTLVQLTLDGELPPLPFNQIQCVDLSRGTQDSATPGWNQLVASVAELTGRPTPLATTPKRSVRPRWVAGAVVVLVLAVAGIGLWLPRAVIIAGLVWGAWGSRSVILNPFDVPPSLASHGITGKVVASEVVDRLKAFQDAMRTIQQKRTVEDAWSNKIELQIPDAGLFSAEILLHRWLSNDEHISGSLVDEGKGIALTVRGDRFAANSFEGTREQLHALAVKAAEYVYGSSEPYLFAVYLENQGRNAEAIALARNAFAMASAADKPLLLSVWSNGLAALGRNNEALDKVREAVSLDPNFWLGYDNLMGDEADLADEESVVATGREMERRARRGGWFAADVPAAYWENIDYDLSDWPALHRDLVGDMAESGGHGTEIAVDEPFDAEAQARMHDWRAATLALETSPGANTDSFVIAESALVRAFIALDAGDYARAASLLRIENAIATKDSAILNEVVTNGSCWLALAETLSGAGQKADADVARGGHYVDCYRFRGDIADHRGDWAAAQKDYAAAVALAPSIPSSYESWGDALVRHGQRDAAIGKFALAHEKGPDWADPLVHWGEALAGEGKFEEAIDKYQQGADDAPNWGRLYIDWGRALDGLLRHAEALEQYRHALSLDLSPRDRAALARCCGN